jgi:hypothetical protein
MHMSNQQRYDRSIMLTALANQRPPPNSNQLRWPPSEVVQSTPYGVCLTSHLGRASFAAISMGQLYFSAVVFPDSQDHLQRVQQGKVCGLRAVSLWRPRLDSMLLLSDSPMLGPELHDRNHEDISVFGLHRR